MAALRSTNISCGVRELYGLYHEPRQILQRAFQNYTALSYPFAHVIFSDVAERPGRIGGTLLARYIEAEDLGVITKSPIRVNPNSGNKIRVWVWTVNKPALTRWLRANR